FRRVLFRSRADTARNLRQPSNFARNADLDGSGQASRRRRIDARAHRVAHGTACRGCHGVQSMSSETTPFAGLGLSPALLRALSDAGYTTPTPIQAQAIPPALNGRDLLGAAQTDRKSVVSGRSG